MGPCKIMEKFLNCNIVADASPIHLPLTVVSVNVNYATTYCKVECVGSIYMHKDKFGRFCLHALKVTRMQEMKSLRVSFSWEGTPIAGHNTGPAV